MSDLDFDTPRTFSPGDRVRIVGIHDMPQEQCGTVVSVQEGPGLPDYAVAWDDGFDDEGSGYNGFELVHADPES